MALRSFFKRVLPEHRKFQQHQQLSLLGDILQDPNIFHLNRRSAAGGVAIGLFVAFMPIPGHMIIAALAAIYLRVNLPLAVVLVWLSNPLTIPPLFFLCYKTGAMLLHEPALDLHFQLTLAWLSDIIADIWEPLLLGCFSLGTLSAIAGYFAIKLLWRISTVRKWEDRKEKNRLNEGP